MQRSKGPFLNLLVVCDVYQPHLPGAPGSAAFDVASSLATRGHEVHVLTTGTRRRSEPPTIHRLLERARLPGGPRRAGWLQHLRSRRVQEQALSRLLEEEGPFDAAVVLSLRNLGLYLPRALERRAIPFVYGLNDDWLLSYRPDGAVMPWSLAFQRVIERGPLATRSWSSLSMRRAVCASEALHRTLREAGAPVPEGAVCPPGSDPCRFFTRPFRPRADAPRLLFAGRLHPAVGCDVAIEALARLRERRPGATLSVAGAGADQELARLREIASARGVSSAVTWLGLVTGDQAASLYQEHDVFVAPSRREEFFRLAHPDGMSSGLPVIELVQGGARPHPAHGASMLVARRPEELARTVERLIEEPELAAKLADNARAVAESRASLVGYVSALEAELIDAAGMSRNEARQERSTDVGSTRSLQRGASLANRLAASSAVAAAESDPGAERGLPPLRPAGEALPRRRPRRDAGPCIAFDARATPGSLRGAHATRS